MAPSRLHLTLKGVWIQEVVFSIPPRVIEVKLRPYGSQLILGRQIFRSTIDLEPFSRRVERWFRWTFHEFLPLIDGALSWQSPHRAALLRAWGAIPCPECTTPVLPTVGEIGIAVEDQAIRS